jgi:septum formation protein
VDEAALKRELLAATPAPPPAGIAQALAEAKALAVSRNRAGALIIGSDQVLALEGELLSKPSDLGAARAQLERLSGKTHRLLSAVVLARGGDILWRQVGEAALTMRRLSPAFLDRYLAAVGKAACQSVGAYQIEGMGIQLFERVEGDHFTIIGMPLLPLLTELRARGVLAS